MSLRTANTTEGALRTANTTEGVRLDIAANGYVPHIGEGLVLVYVPHLGREARKDISRCESIQASSNKHTTLDKCFSKHEKEKKRAYEKRCTRSRTCLF